MYPLPFLTDFYEALSNKIQLSKELLLLSNLKYLCDTKYILFIWKGLQFFVKMLI